MYLRNWFSILLKIDKSSLVLMKVYIIMINIYQIIVQVCRLLILFALSIWKSFTLKIISTRLHSSLNHSTVAVQQFCLILLILMLCAFEFVDLVHVECWHLNRIQVLWFRLKTHFWVSCAYSKYWLRFNILYLIFVWLINLLDQKRLFLSWTIDIRINQIGLLIHDKRSMLDLTLYAFLILVNIINLKLLKSVSIFFAQFFYAD